MIIYHLYDFSGEDGGFHRRWGGRAAVVPGSGGGGLAEADDGGSDARDGPVSVEHVLALA